MGSHIALLVVQPTGRKRPAIFNSRTRRSGKQCNSSALAAQRALLLTLRVSGFSLSVNVVRVSRTQYKLAQP